MKQIRKRLTYANVMSTIAVFLVLGGATALAASTLGKNTVGSKQLKNNAVTAAKIKNGAVTGAKIAGGAIGASQINTTGLTVPNATHADSATKADSATTATNANALGGSPPSAYAKTQLEPVHVIGASQFEHGCVDAGSFGPVGYFKDPFGIVHLQGYVVSCPEGESAFTLPPGFRPPEETVSVTGTNNTTNGLIRVNPDGTVLLFGGTTGIINGITFRAS